MELIQPDSVHTRQSLTEDRYDGNRNRWKQQYSNGSSTETTIFAGGVFEKRSIGSYSEFRHHIRIGGKSVGIVTRESTGTNTTRYVLQDYLGSIAEVTTASGGLDVGESFTAFGARRDASDWSGPVSAGDQSKIDAAAEQGYTLHSNLRGGPFVHMNGRVLDSVTGRFLSADPYVPGAGFTQSFNRYSYVFNNPMSYTDPSGFFPDFDFIYGRDEGRLGVSITIGRSSGPKGSARRQAKGCFVPYATKCYGKGRANDPYEIVFDMPGGPMERYGIPDHLILNVQDGSWEDGGLGGITVWENVKASFWSFGEGVVVEFVVEPAKDAAEGRVIEAGCSLFKPCKAVSKVVDKSGGWLSQKGGQLVDWVRRKFDRSPDVQRYGPNDPPVRVDGDWSENDMKQALLGHPPRGLGSPDLHHADQMPGSGVHEIVPDLHRGNKALHPNKYNQGVTPEMRDADRKLHWWYRAREQGADAILPDWIYD